MTNTEDMRFVRTEKAIRSAFMELVSEGPVGSITASAVCRRAGISRNAFYLHHAGVAALYATLVDELVADAREECLASAQRVAVSGTPDDDLVPAGLAVLGKHEYLLRVLLPADDGSLVKRLAEGLENAYVEAALTFGEHGGSPEYRLRSAFTAWALLGLLRRWFELTDLPLTDLAPLLTDVLAGIQDGATRFLINVPPDQAK